LKQIQFEERINIITARRTRWNPPHPVPRFSFLVASTSHTPLATMPSFTVSKAAVLALFSVAAQLVLAAPEPAITAAAVIPKRAPVLDTREDVSFRQVLALRNLAGRQSKPGMNVCYGVDSICDLFLDMDCPSSASSEDWYRCMCTTGYISAKAA
jgi:hypothetical protein